MEHKKVIGMLDGIEDRYIAEALHFHSGKRRSYWRITAACAALYWVIGISAYAGGLFEPLLEYFSGDPGSVNIQAAAGQTVSNGAFTLRLEGALCDGHVGRAIVSILGLPEEKQSLDIQEDFALYAITDDGEKIGVSSWESSTYTQPGDKGAAITYYPDADMTFVLTWQPAEGLEQIKRLGFSCGGLEVEWETGPVRLPEYELIAAEGDAAVISGLGVYAVTEDEAFGGRILLHYPDGHTVEPSYSGSQDGEYCTVLWGAVIGIGYHDPAELNGISVDGIMYNFAE